VWSIENTTPYGASADWGRDKDGVHEWIVGVRATFDVRHDGSTVIAETQSDPVALPKYRGEDGSSSLEYDIDLIGGKPTTDVVLNGTAYAPGGRPSAEFLISMRVDRIKKVLKAVCDRQWERSVIGLRQSPARLVTKIPVVYERSYGGSDFTDPDPKNHRMDTRNPVGCGLVPSEGQPLPNFEYPAKSIEGTGPAGFGALASFWSPRRELCGTYDNEWQDRRCPLLPEDWDPRSLLCSPADQRPTSHLQGGELVELTNLTPDGTLRFVLPRLHLRFRTLFSTKCGTRVIEHDGELASVIVEPDHPRVILVWLSTLICRSGVDYLNETIVTENSSR
jgi:hypothetical protein